MKHKISISIDENIFWEVRELVRNGTFESKSQAFEHAIKSLEAKEDGI